MPNRKLSVGDTIPVCEVPVGATYHYTREASTELKIRLPKDDPRAIAALRYLGYDYEYVEFISWWINLARTGWVEKNNQVQVQIVALPRITTVRDVQVATAQAALLLKSNLNLVTRVRAINLLDEVLENLCE